MCYSQKTVLNHLDSIQKLNDLARTLYNIIMCRENIVQRNINICDRNLFFTCDHDSEYPFTAEYRHRQTQLLILCTTNSEG